MSNDIDLSDVEHLDNRGLMLQLLREVRALRANQEHFREQVMADMRQEADETMRTGRRHAVRPSRKL